MTFEKLPTWMLRLIKRPPQIAYAIGLGPLIGRLVLLLTTTGRKSGLPRVTPLQYEEHDGLICIGSSRGTTADWYRNILANPRVTIRVGARRFEAIAEATSDVDRVMDYLRLRLTRHPRMVGAMLRAAGLPSHPTEAELRRYAATIALVVVRPAGEHGT